MSPDSRNLGADRLLTLFGQLADLDLAERAQRLAEIRNDEAALADELDDLLRQHDRETNVLAPLEGQLLAGDDTVHIPESIGGYRIHEQIGAGGMGIVYRAEQSNPQRMVALKVLQTGALHPDLRRRFEREVQLLAMLQHPGIAQVYDVGTWDVGAGALPFFTMELVDGLPADVYATTHQLDLEARCRLMASICDAVQHAHDRGVVHRDLKPANVLVMPPAGGSAEPQPKVLDFGIARPSEPDLEASLQTMTGQVMGTLGYMSPEQIAPNLGPVDARSDVYSLGAMLYQLLAERLPHDLTGCSLTQAATLIENAEPTPLSRLDRALRGDIETIVGKALSKEREYRYATAAELALDLRRMLAREPIAARRQTTWYQARKFTARHKALVGGVVATVVALVAGLIGTIWFATDAADSARVLRRSLYDAQMRLAGNQVEVTRNRTRILEIVSEWAPAEGSTEEDLRGFEWYLLQAYAGAGPALTLEGGKRVAHGVHAWGDDGSIAVFSRREWVPSGERYAFEVFDVRTGELRRTLGNAYTTSFSWLSPDRRFVALGQDTGLEVRSYPDGELVRRMPFAGRVHVVGWSPDSRLVTGIVRADDKVHVSVRRADDGEEVRRLDVSCHHYYDVVSFAPDGNLLAIDDHQDRQPIVSIFDTSSWERVRTVPLKERAMSLRWHPRERRLAIGSRGGAVLCYDFERNQAKTVLRHDSDANHLAWHPTRNVLASGGRMGDVRVGDLDSGNGQLLGYHRDFVNNLTWSPDGKQLASGSASVRIWTPDVPPAVRTIAEHATAVSWHPDGRRIVVSNRDSVQFLDARNGVLLHRLPGEHGSVHAKGRLMARLVDNEVVVTTVDDHREVGRTPCNSTFRWDRHEERLSVFHDDDVQVWYPDRPDGPASIVNGRGMLDLQWADDDKTIWRATGAGFLDRIDVDTHTNKRLRFEPRPNAFDVATGGEYAAVASRDHMVHIVSLADVGLDEAEYRSLRGHSGSVTSVDISPDNRRIASGGSDGFLRIWDTETGTELLALPVGRDILAVRWSHDSTCVATLAANGEVKLWDARPDLR